jgi:hypothetical protein
VTVLRTGRGSCGQVPAYELGVAAGEAQRRDELVQPQEGNGRAATRDRLVPASSRSPRQMSFQRLAGLSKLAESAGDQGHGRPQILAWHGRVRGRLAELLSRPEQRSGVTQNRRLPVDRHTG